MKIRTTNFDAVAASAPLNRQASVVRDGTGEHWEPKADQQQLHSLVPLAIKPKPEVMPDLTGLRKGRLVVTGYFGSPSKWAVRCDCGGYETRRTAFFVRPKPTDDEETVCSKCYALESAKKIAKAVQRGRYPDGRPCVRVGLKTAAGDRRLKDIQPTGEGR